MFDIRILRIPLMFIFFFNFQVTRARCYLSLPAWARVSEINASAEEETSSPLLNGEHKVRNIILFLILNNKYILYILFYFYKI